LIRTIVALRAAGPHISGPGSATPGRSQAGSIRASRQPLVASDAQLLAPAACMIARRPHLSADKKIMLARLTATSKAGPDCASIMQEEAKASDACVDVKTAPCVMKQKPTHPFWRDDVRIRASVWKPSVCADHRDRQPPLRRGTPRSFEAMDSAAGRGPADLH